MIHLYNHRITLKLKACIASHYTPLGVEYREQKVLVLNIKTYKLFFVDCCLGMSSSDQKIISPLNHTYESEGTVVHVVSPFQSVRRA